ncbi:hypothetical protein FQN60_012399 [Etheostoma spectabile]|uniref:Uncharacterized protein n=1 Tax=Etheostoma spectabile TaxID=54343 RepID=A0A5J5DP54_9PERO|nr:hypothetical protein FQN60_012399 [Etheostoma spectabile]
METQYCPVSSLVPAFLLTDCCYSAKLLCEPQLFPNDRVSGNRLIRRQAHLLHVSGDPGVQQQLQSLPVISSGTRGSTGSPLLGCPTVTTSIPVTSRQVTAAAAAELKLLFDPPAAGFHIVTRQISCSARHIEKTLLISSLHPLNIHHYLILCLCFTISLILCHASLQSLASPKGSERRDDSRSSSSHKAAASSLTPFLSLISSPALAVRLGAPGAQTCEEPGIFSLHLTAFSTSSGFEHKRIRTRLDRIPVTD